MSGAGRHSCSRRACSRRASGFTLLETLVVVAITALIAMIVVPNLVGSLQMLDLQQTTRLLQADLRVARPAPCPARQQRAANSSALF